MNTRNHRGALIVFEGLDVVNERRELQAHWLAFGLMWNGELDTKLFNFPVKSREEPELASYIGKDINSDNFKLCSLLYENMHHHMEEIKKDLQKGKTVVCSRYFCTVMAQFHNVDQQRFSKSGLLVPDLVILMDTAEPLDEDLKAREILRSMAKEEDWIVVDDSQTVAQVVDEMKNRIATVLENCKTQPLSVFE